MIWNDQRVEALKVLWAQGLTASQIAGRLGGVTRSSVIGKVHRLGLAGRATTSRNKHSTLRRNKSGRRPSSAIPPDIKRVSLVKALFEAEPYTPPVEELVIPVNERKYIHTLEPDDCRWPIGDPRAPDFHFCGKSKIPGLPYCEVHARRAFRPPEPRTRPPAVAAPVKRELEAA